MKIALPRSSRLNKFLNVRHAWLTRVSLGVAGALLTLVATHEKVLAREMFRRLHYDDEFRKALRRLSFYARRSWMRLNLSRDAVFVFCSDLSREELAAMRRFLVRRMAAHPPGLVAGDLAYVSAELVIANLRCENYAEALLEFSADADRMLTAIHQNPAQPEELTKERTNGDFDVVQARTALADFSECMKRGNFPWFVLSGTFLGIVREGGFLKHDYDIDVGMMYEACDIVAVVELLQSDRRFHCGNLEYQTIFEKAPDGGIAPVRLPVFLKVSHCGGVHIDIFVHFREDGVVWHASSLFRWDNTEFKLAPYELEGVAVYGPDDADVYLTENYGNWREPLVDFNSALDTTNQKVVRNPLSVAIFLRRIWLASRTNPKGAQALLNALREAGYLRCVTANNSFRFVQDNFDGSRSMQGPAQFSRALR